MKPMTLVIDPLRGPVSLVPGRRAVVLMVMQRIEALRVYAGAFIRTASMEAPAHLAERVIDDLPVAVRGDAGRIAFRVPAVVLVREPDASWKPQVRFSFRLIYQRDKGRCQYCAERVPESRATFDHVQPKSRGGRPTFENIVIACGRCNQRKGDRTPDEAGMQLLQKPVRPLASFAALRYRSGMPEEWRDFMCAAAA